MQIEYIFVFIYTCLLFWLLPHASFVKNAQLTPKVVRLLLFFKLSVALLCSCYFFNFVLISDYKVYHEEGLFEYNQLLKDPVLFFTDFNKDIKQYGLGGFWETSNSFWGYLKYHLLGKFVALLNLFSRGNFYLNAILFSSFTFLGHIAFYRLFSDIYHNRKRLVLGICFILPSVLMYTACAHKDGIIFISLAFASLCFYWFLKNGRTLNFKMAVCFGVAVFIIFLFRNYVLLAMLPAMAVAIVVSRRKRYKLITGVAFYSFFIFLFFLTGSLNSSLNLPAAVIKRKADFAVLEKGNTNLQMHDLQPTVASFVKNMPQAINHVLLRPYPLEFNNTGVLLAALELYFYLSLILYMGFQLLKEKRKLHSIHPFNIYGFAFFISMIFIIGYTIPNMGAITRYRSIVWVFLLCPLVCNLSLTAKWEKKLS